MKLAVSCLFLFLVGAIMAREPSARSSIDGMVTSDLATVLPGATVGLSSLTGAIHRETVTNLSGYYLLDDLPAGGYTLWAEARGYGCILYPHVAVFRGQRIRQDFHFVRTKRLPKNCEPVEQKTSR